MIEQEFGNYKTFSKRKFTWIILLEIFVESQSVQKRFYVILFDFLFPLKLDLLILFKKGKTMVSGDVFEKSEKLVFFVQILVSFHLEKI